MIWDANQHMVVSSTAEGGPSENFTIEVDLPKAGFYDVDAMWTTAARNDLYIYTGPDPDYCNSQMEHATKVVSPQVTGGWTAATLPNLPERLPYLLLPAGKSTILFTAKACNGGRAPSTAWIELTER